MSEGEPNRSEVETNPPGIPMPREPYDETTRNKAVYRASGSRGFGDEVVAPAIIGGVIGGIASFGVTGAAVVVNNESGAALAPYIIGGVTFLGVIWGIVKKP